MASATTLIVLLVVFLHVLSCHGVMQDFPRSRRKGSDIAGAAALMLVLPSSLVEERSRLKAGEGSSTAKGASATAAMHNESKIATPCPASCFRANPVCGKDGVTYWCGSADAECAGVEVDYTGFCDFESKETGGKGVLAVQSLLLVHTLWLVLAAFLVLLGIP